MLNFRSSASTFSWPCVVYVSSADSGPVLHTKFHQSFHGNFTATAFKLQVSLLELVQDDLVTSLAYYYVARSSHWTIDKIRHYDIILESAPVEDELKFLGDVSMSREFRAPELFFSAVQQIGEGKLDFKEGLCYHWQIFKDQS